MSGRWYYGTINLANGVHFMIKLQTTLHLSIIDSVIESKDGKGSP